ncbi:MAG TPA: T9SS type A sorting domain-containing protein, partial [Bacteroidia bacterium]|nr:T9SS type A sorting domain-containing protein [Bacteroidia bacterium]
SDANGCASTATVSINQPSALLASSAAGTILCNGGVTTLTVTETGGTSPYTGDGTMTNISAGTYSYTVTDNNGCTSTTTITVNQPNVLMASSTSGIIACNGGVTTLTVTETGGTSPYTGDGVMTNISAGTYSYTVTDNNGCTSTTTVTVTEPTVLMASSTSGTIACNGGSTSVTVTETGGTSPFTGDGVMTNISAGTYSYTVTDNNGCTATTTITINQPAVTVQASSTAGTILCNGGVTTVTVTETGGTSPYTGDGVMTNISAGTYSYTVTDNNGCTSTTTITVTEPSTLTVNIATANVSCNGANNGSASVGVTGGTPAYTYTWTPGGANTATINNINAGTYSCNIADNNGCATTATLTITQPNAIDASVTNAGDVITATNASASYQWVDCNNSNAPISGANSQSYTATANGSYAVTVIQGSCSNTSTCTVISNIGIAKYNALNNIQVYPNPSKGEFTIANTNYTDNTTLTIYSSIGQVVYTTKLSQAVETISAKLAPGMYTLHVQNAQGTTVQHLVITD